MPSYRPYPIIAGPTASGKTALAVRLAEALDVLTEEAETKQVILFTCQTREQNLLNP